MLAMVTRFGDDVGAMSLAAGVDKSMIQRLLRRDVRARRWRPTYCATRGPQAPELHATSPGEMGRTARARATLKVVPERIQNVRLDPLAAVSTCANATLFITREAPTIDNLGSFRTGITQLRRTYGTGVVGLGQIEMSTVAAPDTAARAAIDGLVNDPAFPWAGLALVLMSTGFVGAGIRSLLTGMFLVNRTFVPVRIFGAVSDATKWLAVRSEAANGTITPVDDLVTALAALRTQMDSR